MSPLWTPWRLDYIRSGGVSADCVFCAAAAADEDTAQLIVHRGPTAFVILNRYPYSNGHCMVVPYQHEAMLTALGAETRAEMFELAARLEAHLVGIYRCDGLNLGMNIGRSAGAGVVGHLHLHVVPRWEGDTNYMAVVADVRVIPERLEESLEKLRRCFA